MIAPTSFFADYGCHVRILEEARALMRAGCRVAICTYHNGRDLPDLDIRRTPSIPYRGDYLVGSSRHKIGFDALLFLRSLRAMFRFKPDVIHAHLHEGALIGAVLARLWRVPLVFDFQGSMTSEMIDHGFLSLDSVFYRPVLALERLIDRWAPHILTSSFHAVDLLTREWGCDESAISVVPDCVNIDTFCPATRDVVWKARKRALGIPQDHQVIVYLGLLAPYQGIDHLLRAAALLCAKRHDLHFLIAGYPNEDRYRHLAAELGIADHVTLPGKVPYESAPDILALGDVAVAPKLSKSEGAGKLLNYMAMGLPTVAFDTKVGHEYLGEDGIYAVRGDHESLAYCIGSLLDDTEGRARRADALRARARTHYSWAMACEIILDCYAQLGARSPR